jgi:hypothetical protein
MRSACAHRERVSDQRWYILIAAGGDDPQVTIFSNEQGVGRVCIDFTVQ